METIQVNLDKLPCLEDSVSLETLNRLFRSRDAVMLHELATSTGCSQQESMFLLMYLYDLRLAEPFLLVYHEDHLDVPILSRKLLDGFPSVPFTCPECERNITSTDQLSYDYSFKIVGNAIEFVTSK